MKPEVTHSGIFDMQICVPKNFTDEEAMKFANSALPCGTENGWQMRKQGDEGLAGDNERVECAERTGYIHIMLDA